MKPSLLNIIIFVVENFPKIACLSSHLQHPVQFKKHLSSGVAKPLTNFRNLICFYWLCYMFMFSLPSAWTSSL